MTGQISRFFGAMMAAGMALASFGAMAQEEGAVIGQPAPGEIGLQPAATPIMESIHAFHDHVLIWIIAFIVVLVAALLLVVIVRFNARANPQPATFTHNTVVEIIWTVVPILILIVIAIPSFGVLTDQVTIPDGERKYLGGNIFSYGEVEVPAPELTVKATGLQWYWNYEYVDHDNKAYDSILLPEDERLAQPNPEPRLLAVDNKLVVPVDTTVRVQVTAGDVIHAFAVPAFGIKIDAVPGRLNETWFHATKTGTFYGQCSELCGKDHAFMPIAVEVISKEQFATWVQALEDGDVQSANATLAAL